MNLPNNLRIFFSRFDLAFLVSLLFALNFPYLKNIYFFNHDTKQYFEMYYFFYNQLFLHHQIGQWMAFEPFGLPGSLKQFQALDVFSYFTMLIGWVFHVQNVLVLYKWSILLDLLIFLFGMYLLSRHLFKSRIISFFICLVSLSQATAWFFQIYFNLKLFDMLPLTLYLFVLFLDKRKLEFLFLSVLLFCLSLMGSVIYTGALWIFAFLSLGVMYICNNRKGWKGLLSPPFGWHWLGLAVILLVSYAFLFHDLKTWFDIQPGLRHRSGVFPISNYLAYGGPSQNLFDFIRGTFDYKSYGVYLGTMPLFFFFWAIFFVRRTLYLAFLFATLMLWALSFQGLFSLLFYFIMPGMAFYHHLAWFHGVIMIFLLICAGFGMEDFLSRPMLTRLKYTFLILLLGVFFSDAVRITGDALLSLIKTDFWHTYFWGQWLKETNVIYVVWPFAALIIVLSAAVIGNVNQRLVNAFIMLLIFAVVCLNSWSVHANVYHGYSPLNNNLQKDLYTLNVHPVEFTSSRESEPRTQRQKDAYELSTRENGVNYTTIYDFVQFDQCVSPFRVDAMPKGYNKLTKILPQDNKDLMKILGCGNPKLRFVTNALYFKSPAEALKQMPLISNLSSTVVLNGVSPAFQKLNVYKNAKVDNTIKVEQFVDDDLKAFAQVSSPGAWLVYADAYASGWHASIDGKETPVYQAYNAFKAIWVPMGSHEIRFFYHYPLVFWSSIAVALYGIVSSTILILWIIKRLVWSIIEVEGTMSL